MIGSIIEVKAWNNCSPYLNLMEVKYFGKELAKDSRDPARHMEGKVHKKNSRGYTTKQKVFVLICKDIPPASRHNSSIFEASNLRAS